MKKTKKIFSVLLACMMLMSLLSVGVFAAGSQDNPINANDKWFGYGVDCYLMNTTLEPNDTDGVWYELTADAAGILQVEHSSTAEGATVDYQLTVNVNGQEYLGYENGIYNKPIITLPVAEGDVISIHIIAQDTSLGGLVYCNAKFISGANDINQMIKLKSANVKVWIANGAAIYLQDDSLQSEYAAMGLKLQSSVNGQGITVTSASVNYTDTDGDGYVELKLGGSAGSAGVPPVKPSFSIKNNSGEDAWFILNVVENTAHECNWDDKKDTDCNTCGAIRECEHEYFYPCDPVCMICNEVTNPDAAHSMTFVDAVAPTCTANGNVAYYYCEHCGGCWDNAQATGMPLNRQMIVIPAAHTYDDDMDAECNGCGEIRLVEYTILSYEGVSISEDVNGLAFKFTANVKGVTANKRHIANYASATVIPSSLSGELKLVSLGAVVSTNQGETYLENVDGGCIADVTATKVSEFNADTVSYAVRIINIPANQLDTVVSVRPYCIYEDAEGEKIVVYGDEQTACYEDVSAGN